MPSFVPILITVLLVFLAVKWVLNTGDSHPSTRRLATETVTTQHHQIRHNRNNQQVDLSLIQQVQQVAPTLHVEQIKYALQLNHNNVQVVVEQYLNQREFPFPPGYRPTTPINNQNNSDSDPRKVSNIRQDNLLQKFDVSPEVEPTIDEDNMDLLQRKQAMIYKARKEMELRLQRDTQWSSLLE